MTRENRVKLDKMLYAIRSHWRHQKVFEFDYCGGPAFGVDEWPKMLPPVTPKDNPPQSRRRKKTPV